MQRDRDTNDSGLVNAVAGVLRRLARSEGKDPYSPFTAEKVGPVTSKAKGRMFEIENADYTYTVYVTGRKTAASD
jgi:hypothetical protein